MNIDQKLSTRESLARAASRYYVPCTQQLSTTHRHRNFASVFEGDEVPRFLVNRNELQRFSLVQVNINSIFYSFLMFWYYRHIMLRNYLMQMLD
jgi:hypothetical protein